MYSGVYASIYSGVYACTLGCMHAQWGVCMRSEVYIQCGVCMHSEVYACMYTGVYTSFRVYFIVWMKA